MAGQRHPDSGPIGTSGEVGALATRESGAAIGATMGCGCAHYYGHGPWCWHDAPRPDWVAYPEGSGGPRRRRRFDEETLAAHLEDL
jgi:hypothetical protein